MVKNDVRTRVVYALVFVPMLYSSTLLRIMWPLVVSCLLTAWT